MIEVLSPDRFGDIREGDQVWGLLPGRLANLLLNRHPLALEAMVKLTGMTPPAEWHPRMGAYTAVVIRLTGN